MLKEEELIHKFLDLYYDRFRNCNIVITKGVFDLMYFHPENECYADWFFYIDGMNTNNYYSAYRLSSLIQGYIPIEGNIISDAVTTWVKKNISLDV